MPQGNCRIYRKIVFANLYFLFILHIIQCKFRFRDQTPVFREINNHLQQELRFAMAQKRIELKKLEFCFPFIAYSTV